MALVALALTPEWVRYLIHGNEAPLAVGLVLLGIDRHLDGRRRAAFLSGAAACLARPELFGFLLIPATAMAAIAAFSAGPAANRFGARTVLVGGLLLMLAGLVVLRTFDLDTTRPVVFTTTALIVIGGEDTLGVAARLTDEYGVKCVGVPKTIDNDLSGTDYTLGFDTAVHVATEAVDRLHTTAESHHRVLVVEVMGRHAGWIALHSGMAGGANVVLIPEQPFDIEAVCELVEQRFKTRFAPIIVVSEGAVPAEGGDMTLVSGEKDAFGHVRLGGIGDRLASEIEHRTGKEARAVVLGHVQRGGTPTAFDRWLATRFGLQAADAVAEGDFGTMMALRGTAIVRVPLIEGTGELKTVDPAGYAEAEVLFG